MPPRAVNDYRHLAYFCRRSSVSLIWHCVTPRRFARRSMASISWQHQDFFFRLRVTSSVYHWPEDWIDDVGRYVVF